MKNCIVNYSEGQWYPRGQKRLVESLFKVNYGGEVLLFDWFLVERLLTKKCPSHREAPYAFKYYILDYAKEKGYDNVLWLDSSFWAISSLQSLFEEINRNGYVLQETTDCYLGNWCSDTALREMKISREQALSMLMYDGGFIGLNMHNDVSLSFLANMLVYSQNKNLLPGAWTNEKQQVSKDKRVLGHRHDMSVGCVLADKLNMKAAPRGKYWIQVKQHIDFPNVCILGQGM